MSEELTACDACSKAYVRDSEWPFFMMPTCDCLICDRCGITYLRDDPAAPTMASTDEEAAQYDPSDIGACQPCWGHVHKTGKWGRKPCLSRQVHPSPGCSFPCDGTANHRGLHGAGAGERRAHWRDPKIDRRRAKK